MIKSKPIVPFLSSSVKIKDGLTVLGMEAVFEVDTAHDIVNLFNSPDALRAAEIWAHERQLERACEYDKRNLYYSRIYLENSIDVQLQQQIISVVYSDAGGPTFLHIMQRSLRGAATVKMIKRKRSLTRQS